ncbi:MAG: hypothetical protein CL946_11040 [Ectothiorhodospiraceae bacterium]|nr:hypothetical protein [Ectothiorhodospiraceae bacterium]
MRMPSSWFPPRLRRASSGSTTTENMSKDTRKILTKSAIILAVISLLVVYESHAQEGWKPVGMPPVGEKEIFYPPHFVRDTLSHGLQVIYVRANDIPTFECSLIIHAGAQCELPDGKGTAHLASRMVMAGTMDKDVDELARIMAANGARISANAEYEYTEIELISLEQTFPATLEAFVEIITNPAFNQKSYEHHLDKALTNLKSSASNPSDNTSITMLKRLCGEESALSRLKYGELNVTKDLMLEDVRAFYNKHYVPNNATFLIAGNVEYEAIRNLLEQRFASWKSKGASGCPSLTCGVDEERISIIEANTDELAIIRIGYETVPRSSEDFPALLLMNEILGGQRAARLGRKFWGENVLSPSFLSVLSFQAETGYMVISGSVPAKYIDTAFALIDETLETIMTEPVEDAELGYAKNIYTGYYDLNFSTKNRVLDELAEVVANNVTYDQYMNAERRLLDVTKEDIQGIAKKIFRQPRAVVIRGNARTFISRLRQRYGDIVSVAGTEGEK